MLTPERHRKIIHLLEKNGFATIHDLVQDTGSSESTIRRDLSQLEAENQLIRVHGGAQTKQSKSVERTIVERQKEHLTEKEIIAVYAAKKVRSGDCIFLDAGTTTSLMIRHLPKDIIVVTNGFSHIAACMDNGLETFMLGGKVKGKTNALIGKGALDSLRSYRIDKAFIGINGVHEEFGLTTPDPEEASVKEMAIQLSSESFVVADRSKFGKTSFSHVEGTSKVIILTNGPIDQLTNYQRLTKIEVVKE